MNLVPTGGRHHSVDTLERVWLEGVPLRLPVPGNPPCELTIDPVERLLKLETGYGVPEPDLARYRNVSYDPVIVDAAETARISIRVTGSPRNAYVLLTAIADGLQLHGLSLARACADALDRFRDVLEGDRGLPRESVVGLWGELHVLLVACN